MTDSHHVLWVTLEVQGEANNLLTPDVLDELQHVAAAARAQQPRGLILTSGKTSGFIAGIDLKRFNEFNNHAAALTLSTQGQAVCQQFAELPFPTLALIDGFCIGGGLELALALKYRVASNCPATRLGLPEVKLGIHPGFGGSVRSIATIGIFKAMKLMLSGELISATHAQAEGLLDACVAPEQLRDTALKMLLARPRPRQAPWYLRAINTLAPARILITRKLRRELAQHTPAAHYPAPYALLQLWEQHGGNPQAMFAAEATSVAKLVSSSTAHQLTRVFFLKNRLKALGNPANCRAQHVHIVGAETMGNDIAAWCTQHGLRVSVQDHTADTHAANIANADVIIEAITENLAAKQQLFTLLERQAKPDALLLSNTSSIPLEDIASGLREPQRLLGLHFCSPLSNMPLVEVAYDPHAYDQALLERALAFVRRLDKLPLPLHSSPGLLVTRLLMPYLLEGIRLQQQGVPASIIDQTARDFGMQLGPLEFADTIGLDVCQHIGDILARKNQLDVPLTLYHQVKAGKLGKKSGEGFYHYRNGKILQTEHITWNGNLTLLQNKLLAPLRHEAHVCFSQKIVEDADLLDAAMIFGAGFPAFRHSILHDPQV
ncbi:3-hydroxyacyl-CoA dehydrogenase NAD-binding domain-containing protein [Candidatus Thiothrix anitrata]|uniref:Enoyl-CoA hydratase/isomerase family protein n=1 Tax=Candidatus Thiothrix anitrata TaxID=2823902 RepID=A0ABX7WY85_9GAMM|nr:3-hydroxyacyl-CoA dehydrogenase NAD-binding domain-containing protein [Candidatus Thiothrix anitrata]QTR48577.1 enoyl-CoA hydratase/isomerase family protein [Candidatus Thiothrix anitrata]